MNDAVPNPGSVRSRSAIWIGYGLMMVAAVAVFFLVRALGSGLVAPQPAAGTRFGTRETVQHATGLLPLLIALLTIIVASRVVGALFRCLHQPPVVGEVLAGILLGPSLLGKAAPGAAAFLFPPDVVPLLGTLAQIGVLLFMFVIGLELNTGLLRQETHATFAISHASIVLPFLLGTILSLWLYPVFSSSDVPFVAFSLFIGISMSITAFPVLARILKDRNLQATELGVVAMTCAAVDDVTAWCLLALVVGVAQSQLAAAGWTTLLTVLYIAGMFMVVRPLASRFADWYERRKAPAQGVMAAVCVMLLLSSLATEFIGVHTLFGAFLIGAVIPHDSKLADDLLHRLHDVVVVLFLPAFFAFSGLRTSIGLIEPAHWWTCGVIILVACAGKFGGSTLAARWTGMSWQRAASIGILMNTRGLIQLIVLNVGLELGVISPRLFAILVVMALVTTFATTPILDLLNRATRKSAPTGSGA